MTSAPTGRIRFGEFEVDRDACSVSSRGTPIKLQQQPFDLLIILLDRPGRLVSRDDLRERMWPSDTFVDFDHSLNIAVSKLRAALNDSADEPRFIQTVPRRGYRFVGTLEGDPADVRLSGQHLRFTLTFRSREITLAQCDTVIGRDPEAHVCIDEPSVSRRHAAISTSADRAMLRDLGSRNGTFVDGRRIDAPTPLVNGAVVSIGPVALLFAARAAPQSTVTAG
jgi:DNA-binding winged helix-turn-helix (wHTH) protein